MDLLSLVLKNFDKKYIISATRALVGIPGVPKPVRFDEASGPQSGAGRTPLANIMRAATALLLLQLAVHSHAAGRYEVVWDSWFPTECRQHGDATTAADFAAFNITVNEALSPGMRSNV